MKHLTASDLRICHSIPGRLRMKSEWIKESPGVRESLRGQLAKVAHLRTIDVRSLTGSIVIGYDPERVEPARLYELVARALSRKLTAFPSQIGSRPSLPEMVRFAPARLLAILSPGSLWNLVTLSGFLAYRLVRRWLPWSLSSLPMSGLTAGIASVGTLALAWSGWRAFLSDKPSILQWFLASACALAILTGEAVTAVEILWVLSLGTFVERLITERSRRAISDLLQVVPEHTFALIDGAEVETSVEGIRVGDTVVIHDGKRIPVDGAVVSGSGLVDESHITGRADPELREAGAHVFAGTRVVEGTLFVRAERVGKETYLSHILKLVEDSLAVRAPVESKADLLAAKLVRLGGLLTLGTLVVTQSLARSLAVLLVMSCPCATVLATSTALAAAIANGARRGILIKGGRYLEAVREIDTVVFDKTGTITLDTPEVLEIIPRAPWQDPGQVLGLAAASETGSNHPVARALARAATLAGLPMEEPTEIEAWPGRGVLARWDSDTVLVGNAQFLTEQTVDPSYFRAKAAKYESGANSVLYVSKNGKLQGMIVLGNPLRPHCADVIQGLRDGGIRHVSLLSGDSRPVVETLASALGFEEFRAEVLPEEKAAYVRTVQASGKSVMMVGDGLNDALALSEAAVGVAMGAGGSEVAIEAADIALLDNDLQALLHLLWLSDRCLATIEQNFWIATTTNVVGAGLSVFGVVPPVLAGLLHTLHSLGIMANSSRLLTLEPPDGPPAEKHDT